MTLIYYKLSQEDNPRNKFSLEIDYIIFQFFESVSHNKYMEFDETVVTRHQEIENKFYCYR